MNQPPLVFARQRIFELMPDISNVIEFIQLIERGRKPLIAPVKQLDGVLVFVTAIDQYLLFLPLRLKHPQPRRAALASR